MKYPLDELLDRQSIVQLKIERLPENREEKAGLQKEFEDYTQAIEEYVAEGVCSNEQVEQWHGKLYEANAKIWDLEAEIRAGQVGDLSLEEVGRRAIAIREANGNRVGIKSRIVEQTKIGYKDVKINHVSQSE